MTEAELMALASDELNQALWTPLTSGNFNDAYRSKGVFTYADYTGHWVLKIPKMNEPTFAKDDDAEERALKIKHAKFYNDCNDVMRAERKWKSLDNLPFIRIGKRYLVPDLGALEATDKDAANCAIYTFLEQRELVVDLCSPGNCLQVGETSRIVDVGFMMRRGSVLSDLYYADEHLQFRLEQYLQRSYSFKPLTVSVILALRYLESQLRPEDIKDEYITASIISIVLKYWRAKEALTPQIMDVIVKVTTLNAKNIIEPDDISPRLIEKLCQVGDALTCEQLFHIFFEVYFIGLEDKAKGRYRGYSLLHIAALSSNSAWCEKLMAAGFDVHSTVTRHNHYHSGMSALEIAVMEGEEIFAMLLYRQSSNLSPQVIQNLYFSAVRRGYVELVRLIASGSQFVLFKTDAKGRNALHIAAYVGHADVAALIISQKIPLEETTANGKTALDIAVQYEREAVVALLVRAGAKPTRQLSVNGQTILHICAKPHLVDVMVLLLKPYDDSKKQKEAWRYSIFSPIALPVIQRAWQQDLLPLDTGDVQGKTPMAYAAATGCNELIGLLFERGARLNYAAKPHAPYPLDLAYEQGHSGTIAYLKALGAIRNPELIPERKYFDIVPKHETIERNVVQRASTDIDANSEAYHFS